MNKLTATLLWLVLAGMSVPAGASNSQTYWHDQGKKTANKAQKQQNKQLKQLMKQQNRAVKKQNKEAAKNAKMWNKRAQHGVLKTSSR